MALVRLAGSAPSWIAVRQGLTVTWYHGGTMAEVCHVSGIDTNNVRGLLRSELGLSPRSGSPPAYSRSVDDMVFAFADAHLRNVAGRSARDAGYSCTGSHTREEPCLLTVHEADGVRRDSAERIIRATSPAVSRLR